MTVALCHSRFRAVSKPVEHMNCMKSQKSRLKYLLKYIIPIIVSSVILTIPCFWEYEIQNVGDATRNATLIPSGFRRNPYYSTFYVGILCLVILGIFPFTSLVYFTFKISKGIKQNSMVTERLTDLQRKEIRIFNQKSNRTLVANLIAVFFLEFHLLRIGLTIVEFIIQVVLNKNSVVYYMGCKGPFWLSLLTSISELLLVLNSSVNTIIYQGVNGFSTSDIKHQISCCSSTVNTNLKKKRLRSRLSEKRLSNALVNGCCKSFSSTNNVCKINKMNEKRVAEELINVVVNVDVVNVNLQLPTFQAIKIGTEYV